MKWEVCKTSRLQLVSGVSRFNPTENY